ncbi:MAG TPA: hypothetical protein VG756_12380 [Pseudonocardiaceae bacterium]|jgi:hypothetical protein|nr:hypothetical protein [Pseudonocardiaceae bacterium]
MIPRITWIELRRSTAPVLGVLVLLLTGYLLYLSHGPWTHDQTAWTRQWDSLAIWSRQLLMFLCPVALGLGAWQGRRDHRSRMIELLTTVPRPGWQRFTPTVLAIGLALLGGFLLILLPGAIQVAGSSTYQHLGWLPVLGVGLLALVGCGWLGMGLGRLLPSVLTPPLLAVAGLAGVIVAMSTPNSGVVTGTLASQRSALLSPGLKNVTDVFTTVAARADAGQTVWFAGLAATGLALLVVNRASARLVALLPAVVAAVVALAIVPATLTQIYVPDNGASALTCASNVCVSQVHRDQLAALTPPAQQALAKLAILPNAPTTVVEQNQSWTVQTARQPGVVLADFADPEVARYGTLRAPDQVEFALLEGAGTPSCSGTHYDQVVDQRELAARAVAASWLLGRFEQSIDPYLQSPFAQSAWQGLTRLPAAEQRTRIIALRNASLTCQGDLLSVLTGGAQ